MNLNERVHAKIRGHAHEIPHLARIQRRDNQEDGIRSPSTSFVDLIRIVKKVLSQRW